MIKKKLQKKWFFYGIVILFVLNPFDNYSQSVKRQCIPSFGTTGITDSISFEQTAGQSYITTSFSSDKSAILQGFQQPNTFSVEDISSLSLKNLNLSIFPNPASYSITIKSDKEIEQSFIQVIDINGKYILSENINNLIEYVIFCDSWVNGVYLITIKDSQQNSKTFKLIISK